MKIKNLKKSRAKRAFSPQHLPLPPPPTPNLKPRAPRTPDLLSSSSVLTMWIRRRTSRLLGTTYSTLAAPPPVLLAPPPIPEPCSHSYDLGGFLSPATTPRVPASSVAHRGTSWMTSPSPILRSSSRSPIISSYLSLYW